MNDKKKFSPSQLFALKQLQAGERIATHQDGHEPVDAGQVNDGPIAAVHGLDQRLAHAVNVQEWQNEVGHVWIAADEGRANEAKDAQSEADARCLVDVFEFQLQGLCLIPTVLSAHPRFLPSSALTRRSPTRIKQCVGARCRMGITYLVQRQQTGLCGGIISNQGWRRHAAETSAVYDMAMVPLHHLWQEFLDEQHRRDEIRPHRRLDIAIRPFQDASTADQARIVEQHRRVSDVASDALARSLQGACVAQITLVVREADILVLGHPAQRRMVDNDDARASISRQQLLAYAGADAAASSGDDDDFLIPVPRLVRHPVVGELLVQEVVEGQEHTCYRQEIDRSLDSDGLHVVQQPDVRAQARPDQGRRNGKPGIEKPQSQRSGHRVERHALP